MNVENIDSSLLEEIEVHAVYIAREAGQILIEQFRKPLEVQLKGKNDKTPVTGADRRSEEYLKEAIRKKFPGHGILSEEGGVLFQPESPFIWVVDPLDGTINYMNGLPFFAVSIGVLWKGRPVAGSIYVPVSHRISEGVYHARLGKGAFFNDEKIAVVNEPSRIPLFEIPAQFGGWFRLSGKSRKEPREARNTGSIAFELVLTATGIFQFALFTAPRVWDVAAGVLLVKEAGGLVLTRSPKDKNWLSLEQFQAEKSDDKEILENLRRWSSTVIVGAPDTTDKIIKDIRIHRSLRFRFSALRRPVVKPESE